MKLFPCAGAALAVCAIVSSTPAWSQNGHVFTGVPVAATKSGGSDQPSPALANRTIVRDRDAQAVLKANAARILAPDFEVMGDVTIVDGPTDNGFLGLGKSQVVLSVPVRFRQTARLDADFKADKISMPAGTLMYRRTLIRAKGTTQGAEDWCGIGTQPTSDELKQYAVCFGQGPDGKALVYTSEEGSASGEPFYRFPARPGVYTTYTPAKSPAYDGPVPSMTMVAEAPADMTAYLRAFPAEKGTGFMEWARGSAFVWQVSKGKSSAALGYSDESWDNKSLLEDGQQVFRMAWVDLVFRRNGNRLDYQGYIDLTAETPQALAGATTYDATLAGGPAQPDTAWSLGALDFEPATLRLDSDGSAGEARLSLEGHIRQKVRLTEDAQLGQTGGYKADTVFYAMTFDGAYPGGQVYTQPGWCGTIYTHPMAMLTYGPKPFTCFTMDDPLSASQTNAKNNWELMGSRELLRSAGTYSNFLPRYEVLVPGPEDVRDVVIRIRRKSAAGAEIVMAVKDAEGERPQRSWLVSFDAAGVACFNLWTRKLRIETGPGKTLKVTIEDGGDGLGLRQVAVGR